MSDKIEEVIKYHSFTKRWGNNAFCRSFATKIDKWLAQFEKSEQVILLELLKHYDYYIEKKLVKKIKELYIMFKDECKKDSNEIVFCRIPKEYKVGYSDIFVTNFWYANGLQNSITSDIFNLIIDSEIIPNTIVVIDDVSGSAHSFKTFLNCFKQKNIDISNTTIYFLAINITQFALKNIRQYAEQEKIKIIPIYLDTQEKAFSPGYIFNDVESKKEEFEILCKKYDVKTTFGFKNAEALISFEYNTPNDTLGIFYNNNLEFNLFHRNNRKENTLVNQMSIQAFERKKLNKSNIMRKHTDYFKEIMVFAYVQAWGNDFSYIKAKEELGLTEQQLLESFKTLSNEGLIIFNGDTFSLTEEGRKLIYTTHIKRIKKLSNEDKDSSVNNTVESYIPKNFAVKFNGYK